VYEPAYELSFTGVNRCTLQATLAITALLLAIWVSAVPNFRFKLFLPIAAATSVTFQIVIS